MNEKSSSLSSVQKACRILGALANSERARLTDIAAHATLNKVTTLRILEVLTREGYVCRDEQTKTYTLGEESIVLSVAARNRDDLRARARPSLIRLAQLSGDTVLLTARKSAESLCIDREFGGFPIRANYLDVGSRRPLGVGAGSMALLAWLPDQEIEPLLDSVQERLRQYPNYSLDGIRAEIAESRERGYTLVIDRIVDRMGAVGVPVIGLDGMPIAALSIAALSERITSRLDELVAALKQEALAIKDPRRGKARMKDEGRTEN
jgi:DNA-binding IclR family transcriptional regulator